MTILHIDSSIQGANSASRALSAAIVDRLLQESGGVVEYRDLAANPVPHLTMTAMAEIADNSELAAFLAADTIVIGVAMYNFGVPSQLKAWLDRIFVAGKTFSYTEAGLVGLVGDKRAILAVARGGHYSAGSPAAGLEHVETYLRGSLAVLGITDPEVVVAEGLNMPGHREPALAAAMVAAKGLALAA